MLYIRREIIIFCRKCTTLHIEDYAKVGLYTKALFLWGYCLISGYIFDCI